MEAPRNVNEVRLFMGLTGYYRWLIMKFSQISYTITYLHKEEEKFEWTEECTTSFEQLKHLLTNDPVLKIVDLYKGFVACTYACK